jgi:hypothetical protein
MERVAIFLCWVPLILSVRTTQQPQTDSNVFRTETTLVRLDVSVVDAHGGAIPDLIPADFEVRQDGKKRPVLFAEFRREPAPGLAPRKATAQGGTTGRRIVVVVDDLWMSLKASCGCVNSC